jgi:hypothetical protein
MLNAKNADKFRLYEKSVQTPLNEVDFISNTFKRIRGRAALSLREDFCGTAVLACEWAKSHGDRTALGIDLEPKVLAWCRANHFPRIGAASQRVDLRLANVMAPAKERVDAICAYNYSYFIFKTRPEMLAYFAATFKGLKNDGVLFLDLFGGSTSQQVSLEERGMRDFRYIWEQAEFNPIDNHFRAHIHFKFKDNSMMKRAFTYDWRLWQIPELRELLAEAGYKKSTVYWEDTTKDGRAAGTFRPRTTVENDPGWNSYIVAER